ncbi:MAG: HEAT repeat domain-containing protein [Promethearchaeota archaeon]
MSKDIRNLIDLYEIKNRERSNAEITISSLKEEIERLKFTVKEQKLLISELENKKKATDGLSNDINILKDLVLTQRQEIQERDNEILRLEEMLQELVIKYEKVVDATTENVGEELIEAKKLIITLTNENEILKDKIEDHEFELEKLKSKAIEGNVKKELEIANQEIELLRRENMSLSDKITKQLKELRKTEPEKDNLREIEQYKQKIQNLSIENEDLQANVNYLQKQLNNFNSKPRIENHEQLEQANSIIEKLKLEIEDLQAQVIYLRQELEKRTEKELEKLNEIPLSTENTEDVIIVEDEINTDQIITELTAENESYRQGIDSLNQEIADLKRELSMGANLEDLDLANEKIEVLIEENDNLQERNNYLIQEIERLQKEQVNNEESNNWEAENEQILELEDELERVRRNLNNANQTIDRLINEIDNYKNEISELEESIINKNSKISALNEKINSLKRKIGEFQELQAQRTIDVIQKTDNKLLEQLEDLKERVENAEKTSKELLEENLQLNQNLLEIKQGKPLEPKIEYNPQISQNISIPYQKIVYIRLISQLSDNKREKAIQSLIHDLRSPNYNIKRFAISILSEINDDQVYNALVKLTKDKDWMIRFLVVKALSKFDNYNIREPLELLSNDVDLDVREAAIKLLRKLNVHA